MPNNNNYVIAFSQYDVIKRETNTTNSTAFKSTTTQTCATLSLTKDASGYYAIDYSSDALTFNVIGASLTGTLSVFLRT